MSLALTWMQNLAAIARSNGDDRLLSLILDTAPAGVSLKGEAVPSAPITPVIHDMEPVRLEIELILQNKVIPAIKEHRTRTGAGLKESKDAIDRWRDKMANLLRATHPEVVIPTAFVRQ